MKIIKLVIISLIIILAVIAIGVYAVYNISRQIGVSPGYLITQVKEVIDHPKYQDKINFIVLGLDYRDDQLEKTQTTDTIIFASYNLSANKINMVSLPRDIWDYHLGHKINDIYPESLEQTNRYQYIKDNFSRITGQRIDYVIVLNTNALSDLVDAVGGVGVNLDGGFTDYQYPNPEYVKNPSSKNIPVYMTIKYPSGANHLDGQSVIPFVRSRKSLTDGSDIGRIKRQQLVMEAILIKVKSPQFLQTNKLINLYHLWKRDVETDLKDSDLGALALQQQKKLLDITLNKINIPIGTNPKDGQIYHPEAFINLQWVFVAKDKDFKSLHQYIQSAL